MKRSSSSSSSASRASSAPVNRLIVATVALLAFAGAIGLGTVWLRHQISEVARANKQVQARIAETERRTNETETLIAAAANQKVLNANNVKFRLGLVIPSETQIYRVDASDAMLLANNNASAEQYRRTINPVSAAQPLPLLVAPRVVATLQR